MKVKEYWKNKLLADIEGNENSSYSLVNAGYLALGLNPENKKIGTTG